MTKDWKQVAKDQKREIAKMKATIGKWQRMYARLEKAGWGALRCATRAGVADDVTLLEAADKASLFYFRETVRLGKLVERLEAKKA